MIKCSPLLYDKLYDIIFKWLKPEGFDVTFDQDSANVYAARFGTRELSLMLNFHPFAEPPTMDVKASDTLRTYTQRIYLWHLNDSLGITWDMCDRLRKAIDEIKVFFGSG